MRNASSVLYPPIRKDVPLFGALDGLPVGIVFASVQLKILFVNSAMKAFLKRSYLQFTNGADLTDCLKITCSIGDWLTSNEEVNAWICQAIEGKKEQLIVTDCQGRHLLLSLSGNKDDIFALSAVDVTEFRRKEIILKEIQDRLAGEGEYLRAATERLEAARIEAANALKKSEQSKKRLENEIKQRRMLERHLRHIANTDDLTGAMNRRRFFEILTREAERARRYRRPISILMLDIDYFKSINDRFGHAAGDAALCHFSSVCREVLREIDIFARLGGEEFAVLMPETDYDGAYQAGTRICTSIASKPLRYFDSDIAFTTSVGIAELEVLSEETPLKFLGRADKALYEAKAKGRNQVSAIPTYLHTAQTEPKLLVEPLDHADHQAEPDMNIIKRVASR